ncbi:MAG: hypothetical protein A2W27_09485 [Deltaproteobacteria bacterium RBG_16_44_11]|nr:MAG: hypothetical protein A2W27_09485 [Deltaproteobacteria bacterium RBG_16_44_11]
MDKITRRSFIKKTAVATAGISVFPMIFIPKARAHWAPKTMVHPNVNNLRVVGITDSSMTKSAKAIPQTWADQEKLVNTKAVGENIDKLACGLVDTRNPDEAWRTIFIKPPRKSWSDTVVAIKTNCISVQHTRSAVMAKTCHVLTDIIGIKSSNIHIYDACHGHSMIGTPFSGLPEGVKIENVWEGSTVTTPVPPPWDGGKSLCAKQLVTDFVDILVNISMCKGHMMTHLGGFTMAMKNHFGSFEPVWGHQPYTGLNYLIAINKTPEILGKMDDKTGKVLYPRQQLCLVDALWASETGPDWGPTHQPNFLAMGVFSPVVDYVLATEFRGKKMGWEPNKEATRRMLSDFGYSASDLPGGGKIIEA